MGWNLQEILARREMIKKGCAICNDDLRAGIVAPEKIRNYTFALGEHEVTAIREATARQIASGSNGMEQRMANEARYDQWYADQQAAAYAEAKNRLANTPLKLK